MLCHPQSELTELVQTYKQEVTEAACELICDWAQKILKRSFDTVVEIARFLVQEHIVNPRCSQAELVTSAALAGTCKTFCKIKHVALQGLRSEVKCKSTFVIGGPAKPHKVIKKLSTASRTGAEEDGGGVDIKVL